MDAHRRDYYKKLIQDSLDVYPESNEMDLSRRLILDFGSVCELCDELSAEGRIAPIRPSAIGGHHEKG